MKKAYIKPIHQLNLVLNDIHDNNLIITSFVGDNPVRSGVRECLSFSSWYPCEYCFSKGTKLVTNDAELKRKKKNINTQRKILAAKMKNARGRKLSKLKKIDKELIESEKKLKPKQSNIVWPKTTANGPPRTRDEIFDIIQNIENGIPMSIDEAKGIHGRSLFFDIPYFDFVKDIPVDYLHCGCIGVVKKCVELTFKVTSDVRQRITKRPLSSPQSFNRQIAHVKVPRESNRRVRDLDFAVYKGQEYQNLLLYFFPLILNCIEENTKERHVWLYLTYMVKACVIPDEEYAPFNNSNVIQYCITKFYSIYESVFGARNCTYNTHTFSHLLEMRSHGPLTATSAFPFESFYGEMRNSFVPGTNSTLKQIFSNILLKRAIAKHCCEQKIYISEKDTPMECNSLIYCYENSQYHLYKVTEKDGENLVCASIESLPCSFPETPTLNWSLIGVFKKGNISEEQTIINMSEVKGKLFLVNDFLLTCPLNVLREK